MNMKRFIILWCASLLSLTGSVEAQNRETPSTWFGKVRQIETQNDGLQVTVVYSPIDNFSLYMNSVLKAGKEESGPETNRATRRVRFTLSQAEEGRRWKELVQKEGVDIFGVEEQTKRLSPVLLRAGKFQKYRSISFQSYAQ